MSALSTVYFQGRPMLAAAWSVARRLLLQHRPLLLSPLQQAQRFIEASLALSCTHKACLQTACCYCSTDARGWSESKRLSYENSQRPVQCLQAGSRQSTASAIPNWSKVVVRAFEMPGVSADLLTWVLHCFRMFQVQAQV